MIQLIPKYTHDPTDHSAGLIGGINKTLSSSRTTSEFATIVHRVPAVPVQSTSFHARARTGQVCAVIANAFP